MPQRRPCTRGFPCDLPFSPLSRFRLRSRHRPSPRTTRTKAATNPAFFKAQESVTQGSANGVSYSAHAGTLIVHSKDWDDATEPKGEKKDEQPITEMFYVAYFKNGADAQQRPVTFLYNGGPGSSTVWLHMGAF